jgi:hypothetical protein
MPFSEDEIKGMCELFRNEDDIISALSIANALVSFHNRTTIDDTRMSDGMSSADMSLLSDSNDDSDNQSREQKSIEFFHDSQSDRHSDDDGDDNDMHENATHHSDNNSAMIEAPVNHTMEYRDRGASIISKGEYSESHADEMADITGRDDKCNGSSHRRGTNSSPISSTGDGKMEGRMSSPYHEETCADSISANRDSVADRQATQNTFTTDALHNNSNVVPSNVRTGDDYAVSSYSELKHDNDKYENSLFTYENETTMHFTTQSGSSDNESEIDYNRDSREKTMPSEISGDNKSQARDKRTISKNNKSQISDTTAMDCKQKPLISPKHSDVEYTGRYNEDLAITADSLNIDAFDKSSVEEVMPPASFKEVTRTQISNLMKESKMKHNTSRSPVQYFDGSESVYNNENEITSSDENMFLSDTKDGIDLSLSALPRLKPPNMIPYPTRRDPFNSASEGKSAKNNSDSDGLHRGKYSTESHSDNNSMTSGDPIDTVGNGSRHSRHYTEYCDSNLDAHSNNYYEEEIFDARRDR